jgi:hypothetical protein
MTRDNDSDKTRRDGYRDNDDVRRPLEGDDRGGVKPDTKSEAHSDARDAREKPQRDELDSTIDKVSP